MKTIHFNKVFVSYSILSALFFTEKIHAATCTDSDLLTAINKKYPGISLGDNLICLTSGETQDYSDNVAWAAGFSGATVQLSLPNAQQRDKRHRSAVLSKSSF